MISQHLFHKLIIAIVCIAVAVLADIPPKPAQIDYVFDTGHLLIQEHADEIKRIGKLLDDKSSAELVLVTVPSLDNMPIQNYSLKLANDWGIGKSDKNNGCLLLAVADNLLADKPGRVRIEVGRGLEGCLNDAKCGRVLDDLFLPPFQREGSSPEERSKAILDSYTFLAQEIAKEYNVNLELGTTVTLPPASKKGNDFWAAVRFCIGIIIWFLIVAFLPRKHRGRVGGRGFGGGHFGGGGRSFGGGHFGGGGAHR